MKRWSSVSSRARWGSIPRAKDHAQCRIKRQARVFTGASYRDVTTSCQDAYRHLRWLKASRRGTRLRSVPRGIAARHSLQIQLARVRRQLPAPVSWRLIYLDFRRSPRVIFRRRALIPQMGNHFALATSRRYDGYRQEVEGTAAHPRPSRSTHGNTHRPSGRGVSHAPAHLDALCACRRPEPVVVRHRLTQSGTHLSP